MCQSLDGVVILVTAKPRLARQLPGPSGLCCCIFDLAKSSEARARLRSTYTQYKKSILHGVQEEHSIRIAATLDNFKFPETGELKELPITGLVSNSRFLSASGS